MKQLGQLTITELRERLQRQEEDAACTVAHLRALKAQMARRARDADRRAGSADVLQAELDATRKRLSQMRKELNTTKIHLNLETFVEPDESSGDDASPQASDDDDETDEMSLALQHI